jgi:hypothetical protein
MIAKNPHSTDTLLSQPTFNNRNEFTHDPNIQPNTSVHTDQIFNLAPGIVTKLETMQVRMYVYGRIEYRDAFRIDHWLTFCSSLTPGGEFSSCNKYNEIDDTEPFKPN